MTIANLAGTGCPAMIARTMFSEIDLDLKLQFCLSISSVLLSFAACIYERVENKPKFF
jgi:hypothetical protein